MCFIGVEHYAYLKSSYRKNNVDITNQNCAGGKFSIVNCLLECAVESSIKCIDMELKRT